MRKTSAWDVPHKDNIEVAALDVTSQESVDNLVAEIIKKEGNFTCLRCVPYWNALRLDTSDLIVTCISGKIDILVNNAGFGLGGYIESVSVDEAKVSKIWNLPWWRWNYGLKLISTAPVIVNILCWSQQLIHLLYRLSSTWTSGELFECCTQVQ